MLKQSHALMKVRVFGLLIGHVGGAGLRHGQAPAGLSVAAAVQRRRCRTGRARIRSRRNAPNVMRSA